VPAVLGILIESYGERSTIATVRTMIYRKESRTRAETLRLSLRGSERQMFASKRNRSAELYFNGRCLIWAAAHGRFKKIPFFLHHLCSALRR
jgi:hypothetical protein